MKSKRVLAVVMTVFMVLSLLPSMVFAAAVPTGELGGKLKVKGLAAVGVTLNADYEKVTPEGVTDEYVSFKWSRKNGEELTELGTEKTYKITEEDLGLEIVLQITGVEDKGVTGSLTALTLPVAATEEEAAAKEAEKQKVEETENSSEGQEENVEEIPVPEENVEEIPVPEENVEEIPAPQEETPENTEENAEQLPEGSGDETEIPQGNEEVFYEDDMPEGEEVPETPETTIYEAIISTEDGSGILDFGTLKYGFSQEELVEQYVTIENKGNKMLHFAGMKPDHFMVQDLDELGEGASSALWVIPREGLEVGSYEDTITYTSLEGVEVSFTAKVVVEAPEATPTPEPTEAPEATPTPEPTEAPEATPTPEPTEAPEATPTPEPEYKLVVSPETLDFGKAEAGYTEVPEAQTVTVTNKGNVKVELSLPSSNNFAVTPLTTSVLDPEQSASFDVVPVEGMTVGEYIEAIYLYPVINGKAGEALASVTAKFIVEEAKVNKLTVEPKNLDFGSKEAGYKEAPQAQTVTVTNSGNTILHLNQPSAGSFDVGALSAVELAPGESSSFTVAPKKGLEESQYLEEIKVISNEGAEASVTASFIVSKNVIRLKSIQKPADIKGIANGAEKSAAGLKLPATVNIDTTNGAMKANVKWDVAGCAYNVSHKESQTFDVKGTVTLPKGIENPDNITLYTSVKVTVNGRAAVVPDASQNKITGISSEGNYTTETKITFEAVGAGMDNTNPAKGDMRYLPVKWNVLEDRSWEAAPYSATFRMGRGGSYDLKVTFNQQKYDGSKWTNTGAADVKQVKFSVANTKNTTATPIPTKNQKKPVLTGDNTMILPFVIILAVAALCIVGVVVYRKKKK